VIEKLIGSLPPGFLAILALNIVVVGGLFYLEDRLSAGRERILLKMIETCQQQRSGMKSTGEALWSGGPVTTSPAA